MTPPARITGRKGGRRPSTRDALALWLLLVPGCGGDPRALEYVTAQPTVSAVAGRYEGIAWQSALPARTRATADAAQGFTLDLRNDGTFTATNVPEFDGDSPRLVSASGRWVIEAVATLDAETVWGVRFESDPPVLAAALMGPLGRDAPPRRLAFVIGDPDSGEGLMLARKE